MLAVATTPIDACWRDMTLTAEGARSIGSPGVMLPKTHIGMLVWAESALRDLTAVRTLTAAADDGQQEAA